MLNTLPSGALYCRARARSAPQASPTVTRSLPPKVSRLSSRRNSISRGPLAVMPLSGSLAIWSMTSRRKPATPSAIQKLIISYNARRTAGFSQFKSGCCGANWWK